MQIKTLAEIVAENNTDQKSSKRSAKNHKQKQKQQHKSQNGQSRVKERFARDFAVADDNSERTNNPKSDPNQQSEAKRYSKSKKYKARYNKDKDDDKTSNQDLKSLDQTNPTKTKRKKKKKFHPASPYQPKVKNPEPVKEVDPNSIKNLLAQVRSEADDSAINTADDPSVDDDYSSSNDHSVSDDHLASTDATASSIDNLPSALKAYLKTPEQRQAEKEEIKANSRLRWLAFYYLSRREYSAGELRQKLLDKEQDPDKIEELLQEFAEKGYQSDHRTALMLIREGIRKGRGRLRIKNDFYKRKVAVPSNIDELIDMAMEDNEEFVDVLSDNDLVEGVDWLRLAVEARVKKYGSEIPTDQKIKARQLRFLQYRGFKPDICFQALNHNLESLEQRF